MAKKKFLVIDDDPSIHEIIRRVFRNDQDITVITASNGVEGLRAHFAERPDLIFLDIMMSELDGWDTCKQIRLVSPTPIIMLTSLNEDKTTIRALDRPRKGMTPLQSVLVLRRSPVPAHRPILKGIWCTVPGELDGTRR